MLVYSLNSDGRMVVDADATYAAAAAAVVAMEVVGLPVQPDRHVVTVADSARYDAEDGLEGWGAGLAAALASVD